MEPTCQIVVNIRIPGGYAEAGRFALCGDRQEAIDLFTQLKGEDQPYSSTAIRFDLLEVSAGLSTMLQKRFAVLSEAGDNCKLILRETFRVLTLRAVQ